MRRRYATTISSKTPTSVFYSEKRTKLAIPDNELYGVACPFRRHRCTALIRR